MTTTSLIVNQSRHVLDEHWYTQLRACGPLASEIYLKLGPGKAALSKKWLEFKQSGYQANIDLRPSLNVQQLTDIQTSQARYSVLRQRIVSDEKNRLIVTLYVNKIDELLANLNLLLAAYHNDSASFRTANQAIYGTPSRDTMAAVIDFYRRWLQNLLGLSDAEITAAMQNLPSLPDTTLALQPSKLEIAKIRSLHVDSNYFQLLCKNIDITDNSLITTEVGDNYIKTILQNIDASDYKLVDSLDDSWGVIHSSRSVVRPPNYCLRKDEFIAVICHELGSHLLERINGNRQPLKLLALGLDRYEANNEGRALLREQLCYQSATVFYESARWQEILQRYAVISLAMGTDRREPRSFSETYAIVYGLNRVRAKIANVANAAQQAHIQTWNIVTRALKGTNGLGGAYLKDMVYLQGNLDCWQLSKTKPELLLLGDLGKFDITRADHLAALTDLGIATTYYSSPARAVLMSP